MMAAAQSFWQYHTCIHICIIDYMIYSTYVDHIISLYVHMSMYEWSCIINVYIWTKYILTCIYIYTYINTWEWSYMYDYGWMFTHTWISSPYIHRGSPRRAIGFDVGAVICRRNRKLWRFPPLKWRHFGRHGRCFAAATHASNLSLENHTDWS